MRTLVLRCVVLLCCYSAVSGPCLVAEIWLRITITSRDSCVLCVCLSQMLAMCGGSSFVDVLVEPCSIAFSLTVLADDVPV